MWNRFWGTKRKQENRPTMGERGASIYAIGNLHNAHERSAQVRRNNNNRKHFLESVNEYPNLGPPTIPVNKIRLHTSGF